MALLGERVESFPFDSTENGYDEDGYPVYDRAVGASLLRTVFARFFKDGVFDTPADALQIGKGSTGLTVTINPGVFIINGAMGGIPTDREPMVLTLDTGSAQGNTCYGIMLRYDENQDARTLSIRAVKGEPSSMPQPPAPDTTSPGIMEYRLGYATLPSGADTMADAVITNEKGLEVCPYAAPFEEIDISSVVADAQAGANEALIKLLSYFETYRDTIDAALSEEEATYLQQQINAIQEQLSNTDLSGSVDNESIVYTTKPPSIMENKLMVKDGGLTADKINSVDAWFMTLVESQYMSDEDFIDSIVGDGAMASADYMRPVSVGNVKTATQRMGGTVLFKGQVPGSKTVSLSSPITGFSKIEISIAFKANVVTPTYGMLYALIPDPVVGGSYYVPGTNASMQHLTSQVTFGSAQSVNIGTGTTALIIGYK